MSMPERGVLLDAARETAGLDDFGNTWFFDHMDKFIESINTEARLNEEGLGGAQGMVINAMVNRLRHIELVKQNPEIKDLPVDVSAIVVGLPRTGSTMMHRMLSSAKGMTGVNGMRRKTMHLFPVRPKGTRVFAVRRLRVF